MSVRTANRMLNRHSAALPTRPFDACDHGGLSGGHGGLGGGLGGGHNGHTLYSESGSQRSLGEFSQGSQDDSLRRHGSSHVPKPPLFNTPKHMYSGADTSLPLDPGCLHHLLRKVGDHETTVKAQETSIRMLQDRLTRMGQSVVELTQCACAICSPPTVSPSVWPAPQLAPTVQLLHHGAFGSVKHSCPRYRFGTLLPSFLF